MTTPDGKQNLDLVKKHLRKNYMYHVQGLVERWNESMAIFDEWFPLTKERTWAGLTNGRGHHHSGKYKDEELMALAKARKDPVVLEELKADIELYEIIKENFEINLKARTLTSIEATPPHLRFAIDIDDVADADDNDYESI